MYLMKTILLTFFCFHFFDSIQNAPYFGLDDDDTHLEFRRIHKIKKKQPCGRNEEGKTFLPFHISYINVNYNYDCGGSSNFPYIHNDDTTEANRPHKPHKPHRPLNLHQFINSKPLADPLNQDQSSTGQNKPQKPLINFLQNHSNGGFFGLFDGSLINILFGNKPKPSTSTEEIPVHEDLDDVVHEATEKIPPGQYITAYNPLTGQYSQEVSSLKPKRIFKQISNFFEPIYDIF